jgi:hypothetical protein
LNQERKKKGRWIVLRKDTRAKAEAQLTIVEFDESILAAICGLVGPRANTQAYVRFGSLADICNATSDVRFTPNSDRESRHAANGHVRFTPKADMCAATSNVR